VFCLVYAKIAEEWTLDNTLDILQQLCDVTGP